MRILWITPELPFWPGGSGGSTRQFHLLRGVKRHGHEVAVVSPVHHTQIGGITALQEAEITLYPVFRPRSRVREVVTAVARQPRLLASAVNTPVLAWQVEVFWATLEEKVHQAIAQFKPDLIGVEHDWAARWHSALPSDIPKVLTLQNLTWEYYEKRSRVATSWRKHAFKAEASRFRRFDLQHFDAYDLLLTMSDDDRDTVRKLTSVRCESIPNGVDLASFEAAAAPRGQDPLVLFTGSLAYPPNSEALMWLLEEIWPRVRKSSPSARLRVVGSNPPPAANALADESVEITGWVQDIKPHFSEATVVLAPLLSGAGTKLKVLDGLASNRPVVATSVGIEGIDAQPEEHFLLADSAPDFAEAVTRVLKDQELAGRLGDSGREFVAQRYDWESLGSRFDNYLCETVK